MQSQPIAIFPIVSKPYGYTYGEWSARWWQWLLSIPKSKNPAFDSTGANANIDQNYRNVFFLCQTYESAPTVPNRTVTVPSGKSIFMPIINWVSILHIDGETDQELIDNAIKKMDVLANLKIAINGFIIKKGLEVYRAQSPIFEIMLPEDNIVGSPSGPARAVSDGYWLFLEPLDSNTSITSFGSCSSGATKIGVSYNLSFEKS
jgi:hypothetical protein